MDPQGRPDLDHPDTATIQSFCPEGFFLLGMLSKLSVGHPSPTKGLLLQPTGIRKDRYKRADYYLFVATLPLPDSDVEVEDACSDDVDKTLKAFYRRRMQFTPDKTLYLESHGDFLYLIEMI
jgi:hypothetical protein